MNDNREFKDGTRVRIPYFDRYATGTVTIVTEFTCKVMWDGDYDLNYWYYDKSELEIIGENLTLPDNEKTQED